MRMPVAEPLAVAIGRTPRSAALLDAPPTGFAFASIAPISKAFAPMVREGRFAVSEMAIATFLMAKAAGKPLVLLPVVLAERFQEAALLCRADSAIHGAEDLAGKRIAVRAYSQTTGMWLRGTLREQHGVAPNACRWITFEDAHLAEYRDPAWVERAAPGAELTAMLRDGAADAAIFGNELPEGEPFRTVFADPDQAGSAFRACHGFVPVNHLLVARADIIATRADDVARLVHALAPTTRDALAPALTLASRFCAEQGLIARPLTLDEIWDGSP
jgi:4,5-dihydroxyphthalate decarboxylase